MFNSIKITGLGLCSWQEGFIEGLFCQTAVILAMSVRSTLLACSTEHVCDLQVINVHKETVTQASVHQASLNFQSIQDPVIQQSHLTSSIMSKNSGFFLPDQETVALSERAICSRAKKSFRSEEKLFTPRIQLSCLLFAPLLDGWVCFLKFFCQRSF